ncbi:hypothetical protein B0H11DRAFT_2403755 [Mycena galericulata]|nr:hypothetical protein B0H11DRAFT_2403755 [Mycena galericulata]
MRENHDEYGTVMGMRKEKQEECALGLGLRVGGRYAAQGHRGHAQSQTSLKWDLGRNTAYLRNISPILLQSATSVIDINKDIVLPQLQPVLASVSLADASASSAALDIEKLALKNAPMGAHGRPQVDGRNRAGAAVQLTLEILTGACVTPPDPGPDKLPGQADEDEDGDEGIEGAKDEIPDVDMAIDDANPDDNAPAQTLPALVGLLLALIQPTTLSFPPLAPSPYPPTTSALSAIHFAALDIHLALQPLVECSYKFIFTTNVLRRIIMQHGGALLPFCISAYNLASALDLPHASELTVIPPPPHIRVISTMCLAAATLADPSNRWAFRFWNFKNRRKTVESMENSRLFKLRWLSSLTSPCLPAVSSLDLRILHGFGCPASLAALYGLLPPSHHPSHAPSQLNAHSGQCVKPRPDLALPSRASSTSASAAASRSGGAGGHARCGGLHTRDLVRARMLDSAAPFLRPSSALSEAEHDTSSLSAAPSDSRPLKLQRRRLNAHLRPPDRTTLGEALVICAHHPLFPTVPRSSRSITGPTPDRHDACLCTKAARLAHSAVPTRLPAHAPSIPIPERAHPPAPTPAPADQGDAMRCGEQRGSGGSRERYRWHSFWRSRAPWISRSLRSVRIYLD